MHHGHALFSTMFPSGSGAASVLESSACACSYLLIYDI